MIRKTLLVISDKFENFTSQKDVITRSRLVHLLSADDVILPQQSRIQLVIGQGFSESAINELLEIAGHAKNRAYFDFSLCHDLPVRAQRRLTHKHNIENTLVSEPSKQSDTEFLMDLLIDEDCEMMRDHQTGLHIQGMLLVEAARQAYLATMEKFFNDLDNKRYFVFNNLSVDYNRFAFPLPGKIKVTIREHDTSNAKREHTIVDIEILQCDVVSSSVRMDVTIMPENRVTNMESRLATKTLNDYINTLTSDDETGFGEVVNV